MYYYEPIVFLFKLTSLSSCFACFLCLQKPLLSLVSFGSPKTRIQERQVIRMSRRIAVTTPTFHQLISSSWLSVATPCRCLPAEWCISAALEWESKTLPGATTRLVIMRTQRSTLVPLEDVMECLSFIYSTKQSTFLESYACTCMNRVIQWLWHKPFTQKTSTHFAKETSKGF